MNRPVPSSLVIALVAASLLSACGGLEGDDFDLDSPAPSSSKSSSSISTQQDAEELFSALKSMAAAIDGRVPKNFSSPVTVTGTSGKAIVSGTKTAGGNTSTSSTSTTRTSNLTLTLTGYKSGQLTVTGTLKWYDYYYSRTACSSTTCASASDHSESLSGTSLQVTYTPSSGVTMTDRVTVSASSGKDTSRWSVSVTNQAGKKFTFSAY